MSLVQEILGHKRLRTTQAYYAEVCKIVAEPSISSTSSRVSKPGKPSRSLVPLRGSPDGSLHAQHRLSMPPPPMGGGLRKPSPASTHAGTSTGRASAGGSGSRRIGTDPAEVTRDSWKRPGRGTCPLRSSANAVRQVCPSRMDRPPRSTEEPDRWAATPADARAQLQHTIRSRGVAGRRAAPSC